LTIFSRFGFLRRFHLSLAYACSWLCSSSPLCVRITWFFGLFLDDNLFVVHMISHMVTL